MLSSTDTALDLLALQLVLHRSSLWLLLLGILAPVDAWLEDDVLADGGGVHSWSSLVLSGKSELAPLLALCDTRGDNLLHNGCADAACGLDLLAVIVQAVCDDRLGSILVGGDLLWWEFEGGIVELFVIGPVLAAVKVSISSGSEVQLVSDNLLCYLRHFESCGYMISAVVKARRKSVAARWIFGNCSWGSLASEFEAARDVPQSVKDNVRGNFDNI